MNCSDYYSHFPRQCGQPDASSSVMLNPAAVALIREPRVESCRFRLRGAQSSPRHPDEYVRQPSHDTVRCAAHLGRTWKKTRVKASEDGNHA